MTLEERLQRRLKNWRAAAREHRSCMDELNEEVDEYWMHKVEAEVFERVISELVADLSARSDPPRSRRSRPTSGGSNGEMESSG